MSGRLKNLERIDSLIEPMLQAARIPGAAIAVVAEGELVLTKAYGVRNVPTSDPMTPATLYPIASTTKAINATLLGTLVDEGHLSFDAPVQSYLPGFRLADPCASAMATVRDLLAMRTGLPRHDFMWFENSIDRAELVRRLQFLPPTAGFRERFQYNNLTTTVAGHIAEVSTGKSWNQLVRERVLEPLGMCNSGFTRPSIGDVASSFHENQERKLIASPGYNAEPIGPAGSAIYSTIGDMARWVMLNLGGGAVDGRRVISEGTLGKIHAPCVAAGADPPSPSPEAAYAMGWFVDHYNGHHRLSHTGYLFDLHSSVMLFPRQRVGYVSFVNFGCSRFASLINEHIFDLAMGLDPAQTSEDRLAAYERDVASNHARIAAVRRVEHSSPSHPLSAYVGQYSHPAYGSVEVDESMSGLLLRRGDVSCALDHWHYDAWVAAEGEAWGTIHQRHLFDRASRFVFHTSADGEIASLAMGVEPTLEPALFVKQ